MNKRYLLDILEECIAGLKDKTKSMTRLENELIKTYIEGNETVRLYRQYEVRYKIVEEKEVLLSRNFIRFYTEIISLKKPAQRSSFSQSEEETDFQLAHNIKQNTKLYMKSDSKNNLYC